MIQWIEDTQEFQKILNIEISSEEEMVEEWKRMKPARRKRAADSIREHRVIQDEKIISLEKMPRIKRRAEEIFSREENMSHKIIPSQKHKQKTQRHPRHKNKDFD